MTRDEILLAIQEIVAHAGGDWPDVPGEPEVLRRVKAIARMAATAALRGREFFGVIIASGTEGVVFTDEADANSTAGTGRRNLVCSTLGEAFRETYDEQQTFEIVRLREVRE